MPSRFYVPRYQQRILGFAVLAVCVVYNSDRFHRYKNELNPILAHWACDWLMNSVDFHLLIIENELVFSWTGSPGLDQVFVPLISD